MILTILIVSVDDIMSRVLSTMYYTYYLCVLFAYFFQVACQACLALRNLASDGKGSHVLLHNCIYKVFLWSLFSCPLVQDVLIMFLSIAVDNQVLIVRLAGLKPLHTLIQNGSGETLVAALACLRNLSMHLGNEVTGTFCEASSVIEAIPL